MAIISRPGLPTIETNDEGQTVRSVPQVGQPAGTLLLSKPDQKELVVNPIGDREQAILDAMRAAQHQAGLQESPKSEEIPDEAAAKEAAEAEAAAAKALLS